MGVVVEKVVLSAGKQEAFEKWLQVVWMEGGGLGHVAVEDRGNDDHVGCLRRYASVSTCPFSFSLPLRF